MKKVILSTLSILGVFTTFAVTPPLTSHAYNISLSDRACDSMRGKVDIPQTELPGLSSQTEQILLAHNKGGKLGSQPPMSYVTKLLVQNPNQPSVTTWVTLPTTSSLGGPTDVSQLRIVDEQGAPVTITPSTGSQGAFTLPTGGLFTVGSTIKANIFDGILFTFNALPQCPCS
ncbi:MAG: hypothetical protein K2Z81_09545, partial [Cyanobacteria bacterium]|nr:hypothetical protein [Cyanobacteriota bacterium]